MVATHATRPVDSIESKNPNTGEVIGTVPSMTAEEVDRAVARARAAFPAWSALSPAQRRSQLIRFRRALASRCEEIADLIHRENGKPKIDAMMELFMALGHLAYAADRAEKALAPRKVSAGLMANFRATVSYAPLGVVGVIGPWNYPIFTPFGSITYALAAGNTVVFKPSELTPLTGQLFCDIAASAFSVPDVLICVTGAGATGGALARAKIDKVAFTGSAATGKRVMQAAAENLTPVLMELGGKDAMIVADDADVDKAAEAAVWGALTNAGQACISVERAYVAAGIYDRFVDKVVAEASKVKVGGDSDSHIGAITRPQQVDIIRDHIQDAVARGAKVLVGGVAGIKGDFVPPTVLTDVTPDMKIMTEETFGPVLPVVKVQSVDEAVRLANDSKYGLGSAVFGKAGVREIADKIRAGMTSINAVLAYAAIPSLPFGGVGDSGFGRIHGDEGLREFTRIKSTAEERFALPVALLSFKLPKGTYERLRGMVQQLYGGGLVDRATATLKDFF
jgi:acyl-CoA reductase-like NAD-dependent aldehyde dehydrogenase